MKRTPTLPLKTELAAVQGKSPLDGGPTRIPEQLRADLERVRKRLGVLVAPPHHRIQAPITHGVEHTGRLLRPTLVLLSSYLLQDDLDEATHQRLIDAAAVVEILHTATLYHDDVIDDAQVRRGQPTVNARHGATLALLAGDFLLARCMQIAASLGVSRVRTMAETLVDVCAGQMLESSQLFDPLRTEDDYLTAISGKTARLMRTATLMGALQCGADEVARDALERFGHHLGMAFQIWDDILDLCGAQTGKQVAKDLFNGVYTLPVIYAVEESPDRLLPLLREQTLSPEQCQEVLSVLHECGAVGRAARTAQRHVADALAAVESQPSFARRAPAVRRCLHELVGRLVSQHPDLRSPAETVGAGPAVAAQPAGEHTAAQALIRDWLDSYICEPDQRIGRKGPVCPFVAPSLRAGALEIRVRSVGTEPSVAGVTGIIHQALDEFDLIEWQGSNLALRSLVVCLPDLPEPDCRLLDEAHRTVKSLAVRRGMMVGQLHPQCEEPSARNPEFPVNRSPVPLVAIRRMALHDILFLKDSKEWFHEYHRRFGHHYKPGREALDPLFTEAFRRARAEYGTGT
ncbi:polyprenyl synthetase family protein [Streptomyces spirodelae]|uniref:Polyprenyl synthetase family protein n=1 Tax=Streptomyces spirodelae TaxID=2812904 RepID=A0ABS3WX41_9ACTN|nr:polyprenyl synthetase family protein [Streptomyces spirodelae]MBO8187708.1 polyprenyl synthetase family protein [Streptomyces spirodelae]